MVKREFLIFFIQIFEKSSKKCLKSEYYKIINCKVLQDFRESTTFPIFLIKTLKKKKKKREL